MKVAIIGAGAMGSLYGGRLSAAGHEIWLIDVIGDHIDAVLDEGLIIEEKNADGLYEDVLYKNLNATMDPAAAGQADLVIVFVKSIATAAAVQSCRALFGPETVALTLQNGLGNIEAIEGVIGNGNVIAGTTAHGATMIAPGRIRHAGIGMTVLGELDGRLTGRVQMISRTFSEAGLETSLSQNILGLVWDKLLVNVGINALTALTGRFNGELIERRELEEILELAVAEGKAVADGKGITLNYKDPAAHAKDVCKATAENRSSMLQDMINNRATEIDMINGAIVREGRLLGIMTPVNIVLTDLVRDRQTSGGRS